MVTALNSHRSFSEALFLISGSVHMPVTAIKNHPLQNVITEITKLIPHDLVNSAQKLNSLAQISVGHDKQRAQDIQTLFSAINVSRLAEQLARAPGFEEFTPEKLKAIMEPHLRNMSRDVISARVYHDQKETTAEHRLASMELKAAATEFANQPAIKSKLDQLVYSIWNINDRVTSDIHVKITIAIAEKKAAGENITINSLKEKLTGHNNRDA